MFWVDVVGLYTLFRGSCFLFQFDVSSVLPLFHSLCFFSFGLWWFSVQRSPHTPRSSLSDSVCVCVCVFQCFDLDKFEGVSTEAVLVEQSFKLLNQDRFWAGLVFTDLAPADPRTPPHIRYKIRMDIGDTERTDKIKERSEPNTQDHNINT